MKQKIRYYDRLIEQNFENDSRTFYSSFLCIVIYVRDNEVALICKLPNDTQLVTSHLSQFFPIYRNLGRTFDSSFLCIVIYVRDIEVTLILCNLHNDTQLVTS